MRAYLILEYDGTAYAGWQRQKNGVSVQQKVEEALQSVLGKAVKVTASGRTDAGVHAAAQTVHLDYDGRIPPERLSYALNAVLPDDVSVKKSGAAADDFHARYSAKKKTYRYTFVISDVRRPLHERYAARISGNVDAAAMHRAAQLFVGEHDFKAFCSTGSSVKTTVRTVYRADVVRVADTVTFTVTGNGFLYNMVRIMAGTLLAVGQGKQGEADIAAALRTGERKRAGKTLPAAGLTLESVEYA